MMDRRYQGNPMRIHMMNPDVQPEHFPIWLGLFETTARHVLTPTKADNIMALAHRIGAGLNFWPAKLSRKFHQTTIPWLKDADNIPYHFHSAFISRGNRGFIGVFRARCTWASFSQYFSWI